VKDAEQFGLPPPDPTPAQTARILGASRRTPYVLIASGHLENYLLGGGRRVRASIRRYRDQCRIAGTNFSRAPQPSSAAAASDAP
jgi:excisionase family DNA binding protein